MAAAGDILTEFKVASGYTFTPSGTEKVMITGLWQIAGGAWEDNTFTDLLPSGTKNEGQEMNIKLFLDSSNTITYRGGGNGFITGIYLSG